MNAREIEEKINTITASYNGDTIAIAKHLSKAYDAANIIVRSACIQIIKELVEKYGETVRDEKRITFTDDDETLVDLYYDCGVTYECDLTGVHLNNGDITIVGSAIADNCDIVLHITEINCLSTLFTIIDALCFYCDNLEE